MREKVGRFVHYLDRTIAGVGDFDFEERTALQHGKQQRANDRHVSAAAKLGGRRVPPKKAHDWVIHV